MNYWRSICHRLNDQDFKILATGKFSHEVSINTAAYKKSYEQNLSVIENQISGYSGRHGLVFGVAPCISSKQ